MVSALLLAASASIPQAFWARDLGAAHGAFERTLVLEGVPAVEPGAGPLHLWAELFELVDCVPLALAQRAPFVPRNAWERLVGLARLERLRLARLGPAAPIARDLRDDAFFKRIPAELPADVVAWPPSDETWNDEYVRPEPGEGRCSSLGSTSRDGSAKDELALGNAILQGLSVTDTAWFTLAWHRAALLVARGDVEGAIASVAPLSGVSLANLTPAELAVARLLGVMAREGDDPAELAALVASPYLVKERGFLEARLQATLAKSQRWTELLEVLPESPSLRDPVGRYQAWLRGRAAVGAGRAELLLGHVRATLRRASEAESRDSSIAALAELEYALLADAPFDETVVEIIESLGEPRLVHARLATFARIALERGRYGSAREAWSWLLAHHQVAEYHPRYRAGLAEVAFLVGDLPVFKAFVRELAASDPRLVEAIPPARRGAFFLERDRQLVALSRELLPRLADRADDRWTGAFVELLQQFLRESPESRVLAPLTELYRTARTLLGSGAHAYAEKIGAAASPLVLGEVEVARSSADPQPPRAPPVLHEPPFLVRIPVGAEATDVRGWFSEVTP